VLIVLLWFGAGIRELAWWIANSSSVGEVPEES
jgi:hypothetical protein